EQSLLRFPSGAANKDAELRLGAHSVDFHSGPMRVVVRVRLSQGARDEIGVGSKVRNVPVLKRDDGVDAGLEAHGQTARYKVSSQAPGERGRQACISLNIAGRKDELSVCHELREQSSTSGP